MTESGTGSLLVASVLTRQQLSGGRSIIAQGVARGLPTQSF